MQQGDELTIRQQEILSFIRSFQAKEGMSPTVREIGKQFGIASPNGVMCHLRALEKKGSIDRRGFTARAIAAKPDPEAARLQAIGAQAKVGFLRIHDIIVAKVRCHCGVDKCFRCEILSIIKSILS